MTSTVKTRAAGSGAGWRRESFSSWIDTRRNENGWMLIANPDLSGDQHASNMAVPKRRDGSHRLFSCPRGCAHAAIELTNRFSDTVLDLWRSAAAIIKQTLKQYYGLLV
jgi:hypothetical protein